MLLRYVLIALLVYLYIPGIAFAGPASTHYQLVDYGFGAGSTASSSSTTYSLNGSAGEIDTGQLSSTHFKLGAGLNATYQASTPPAPTFSNLSSNYDRLQIIINTGGNPTDTTYAIAISSDGFVSDTRYVESDNTIGTSFSASNFLTYSGWGGSSGSYITGLDSNTTYTVKVKAKQGTFTETGFGPTATATTTSPSLTFGVDSATVTFANLNSANSYTDTSQATVLTTSTNAYSGYVVNARETGPLTLTTDGSKTIPDYISPNSAPTAWSGTGFGYTTSDSNLTGGTVDRFTNGGPHYAGFTTSSPGDPVADHPGPVVTAISDEAFTVTYRVTAASTTPAGAYKTTVLYIVVPTY